jgi:hypothetical protein
MQPTCRERTLLQRPCARMHNISMSHNRACWWPSACGGLCRPRSSRTGPTRPGCTCTGRCGSSRGRWMRGGRATAPTRGRLQPRAPTAARQTPSGSWSPSLRFTALKTLEDAVVYRLSAVPSLDSGVSPIRGLLTGFRCLVVLALATLNSFHYCFGPEQRLLDGLLRANRKHWAALDDAARTAMWPSTKVRLYVPRSRRGPQEHVACNPPDC